MSTAAASPVEPNAPVQSESTSPRLSNTALLTSACAVLLIAPLCFGAVQFWAIFALEACAALLLVMWALRQWTSCRVSIVDNCLYLPMVCFVGIICLQWAIGSTAYRHATYSHVLLYSAYGMLVFVTTQSLRRSSQLRILAWIVCIYGGVVAAFALLQGIAPNGKLYWIWPLEHAGLIYGPYVNHNHYAGLMEMLTPFPLVLAVSRFTHHNRKLAAAAVGALMAGTIFLSGSRGGIIAFAAEMTVLIVLLSRRPDKNWKQPALLTAFLVVMIAALIWIGGNEVTHRLTSIHAETQQELSGGTRLTIDRDALRMWSKHPLIGWGIGTFPEVYPQFRSFYTTFFVNEAHNDYAQLLVETGLLGFGIAAWFIFLTVRHSLSKLANWTETSNGVLTAAALLGCIGILVHSFVDFNLQIPANAAMFYVLCALAAGEPIEESRRHVRRRRRSSLVLEVSQQSAEP